MYKYIMIITVVWLICFSFSSTGNELQPSGKISGVVYDDDGSPVAGATVVLFELNTGVISSPDGSFSFTQLRQGVYHIHVSHVGYSATAIKVELSDKGQVIEITLKPTFIELQEVIVGDQRWGMYNRENSLGVATADRKYLSQTPAMTLIQSLERMPGVQAMNIGTGMSKPSVRGMNSNRIIVAENNIKQQGQQWGSDHGLEIDPFGVERVEVIKGPATLLFGSDAIGGAINIRPAVIPLNNSLKAEGVFIGGSNNDLLGTSVMTSLNNNGAYFRFRGSLKSYADYRVPADSFNYNNWVMPLANNRLKNTSGNDQNVALTTGLRKHWGISSITISNFNQTAGFFPGAHGVPDPGALAVVTNPRHTDFPMQKVNHFKVLSNSNLLLGNHWMEVDMGFQQNHRRELNPPHIHGNGPLPQSNTELELLLNTFSSSIKFHHNLNTFTTWIYGLAGNIQQNKRDGYNFLLPDFQARDAGIFVINRFQLQQHLFLNAGVRADISNVSIEEYYEPVWIDPENISHYQQRSPDFSKTFINSTANFGISWFPSENWNIKANTGSSYRTPNAIELSADGIHHGSFRHEKGDTSLRPERALQLDVSIVFERKELYLALSPFFNYFTNYLFLNPSGRFSDLPGGGQVYVFEQAKALHTGAELYFDWHLSGALHTSLGAELLYAQNLDDNYPLPFIPPHSFVFELSYHWEQIAYFMKHTKIIAGLRSSAAQTRVARNEQPTLGSTIANIGLSTELFAGKNSVELSFHVQNLFDAHYFNHLSFYRKLELPEPGRNFMLTLRIPLIERSW